LAFSRQQLGSDPDISSEGARAVSIAIKGEQVALTRAALANLYVRSGKVTLKTLDLLGDDAPIALPGTEFGRTERGNIAVGMDGFSTAYAKLRTRCSETTTDLKTTAWLSQLPKAQGPAGDPNAAALTAQLPHAKEAVSDPRTVAWLSNLNGKSTVGTPGPPGPPAAAAPNATPASGDGSQTIELARTVAVDQKLRVDFLYYVWTDCSSTPVQSAITERPQHGAITMKDGQEFPDFPKDDQRAACNTRKANGKFVFYEPDADYHGTDSFTIRVLSASGHPLRRHYSIDVK
jgi:hypothetical protein